MPKRSSASWNRPALAMSGCRHCGSAFWRSFLRCEFLLWVTPGPVDRLSTRARSLLLHPQLRTCHWRLTPLTQCANSGPEHSQQSMCPEFFANHLVAAGQEGSVAPLILSTFAVLILMTCSILVGCSTG